MKQLPILLVEDDANLREALAETLKIAGYDVLIATDGGEALAMLEQAPVLAVVTDYQMQPMDGYELLKTIRARLPQLPVLIMTAHGTIQHAVQSILEGASDYLVKPFSAQTLIEKLRGIMPRRINTENVVAEDPTTRRVLELALKVASRNVTVLVTGESGTGKEVIARCIHQHSQRASGPFIAINCAAIPENMLEAMLFGHEKGAFTGAHESRAGKFEQAQGGTLLLDEVSEMDLGLQAKLLRVLQEKEVERIGGKSGIELDVRIVATTNRDLASEVTAGRFREDLFYRLSVFPVELPPLRERRRDILPLAQYFLEEVGSPDRPVAKIDCEAASALCAHSWPGNVRQLQNAVQRALILCDGNTVRLRDLRLDSNTIADPVAPQSIDLNRGLSVRDLHTNLQSIEDQLVIDALQRGGGNRKKAAELLGISPRTLRYKIARLRDAGVQIPTRGGAAISAA